MEFYSAPASPVLPARDSEGDVLTHYSGKSGVIQRRSHLQPQRSGLDSGDSRERPALLLATGSPTRRLNMAAKKKAAKKTTKKK